MWDGDKYWEWEEKRKWGRSEHSQTEAGAWGCVGVGHASSRDGLAVPKHWGGRKTLRNRC